MKYLISIIFLFFTACNVETVDNRNADAGGKNGEKPFPVKFFEGSLQLTQNSFEVLKINIFLTGCGIGREISPDDQLIYAPASCEDLEYRSIVAKVGSNEQTVELGNTFIDGSGVEWRFAGNADGSVSLVPAFNADGGSQSFDIANKGFSVELSVTEGGEAICDKDQPFDIAITDSMVSVTLKAPSGGIPDGVTLTTDNVSLNFPQILTDAANHKFNFTFSTAAPGDYSADFKATKANSVCQASLSFKVTDGDIPAASGPAFSLDNFHAKYFLEGSASPTHEEEVALPSIRYAWSEFHGIPSGDFMARWEGVLRANEDTKVDIHFDQSHSTAELWIDGAVVSLTSRTVTHDFNKGNHEVVIEFHNNWHTTGFNASFTQHTTGTKAELSAEIQALAGAGVKVIALGAYEAADRYNKVEIDLSQVNDPIFMFLTSYRAVNYVILNPNNVAVKGVAVNSYAKMSNANTDNIFHLTDMPREHEGAMPNLSSFVNSILGRNPDYKTGTYRFGDVMPTF